jgi:large subunit ribosomal protein L3
MKRLLAIKKEMTQVFDENGKIIPVTILDISNNYMVAEVSTDKAEKRILIGKDEKANPNNAETGKYKSLGFVPKMVIESKNDDREFNEGEVEFDDLKGKEINVTGISKGKGFQGVVKRWGFKGMSRTHGTKDKHRAPGSVGAGTDPSRVFKGKKMAGQMGAKRVTIENLKIVEHDKENNFILVKGSVPGPKKSELIVSYK